MEFISNLIVKENEFGDVVVILDRFLKRNDIVASYVFGTAASFFDSFIDNIFWFHALSDIIVSDPDQNFTSEFYTN